MSCPGDNDQMTAKVLELAQEAALLAGGHMHAALSHQVEIKDTKSADTDLVTETDQRCEEIITESISKAFPSHKIIGEESCGQDKYQLTDDPTWTIDPIDGTTNFVHRLKLSCVIISFLVKKEPIVGLIYDPYSGEMFHATKGKGAFIRCTRDGADVHIRVSETANINRAVISMDPGYGRDQDAVSRFVSIQNEVLSRGVRNVRVLGSTGLNMAYIACGRLDAGFEEGSWEKNRGPKIWDFAAGKLLVSEAGGVTRDLGDIVPTEKPLDLMGRSFFCAATTGLARELMSAISRGQSNLLTSAGGKHSD